MHLPFGPTIIWSFSITSQRSRVFVQSRTAIRISSVSMVGLSYGVFMGRSLLFRGCTNLAYWNGSLGRAGDKGSHMRARSLLHAFGFHRAPAKSTEFILHFSPRVDTLEWSGVGVADKACSIANHAEVNCSP